MAGISKSLQNLIDQLGRLPGVGRRSAERIAYHVLRVERSEALALAEAIVDVRKNVRYCEICYHLAEGPRCEICSDPRRDQTLLCVVEHTRDLLAIEQTGQFRGLYHVLLGRISPLDGIGADQLTIDALTARAAGGTLREVILATNPTVEGDGTALYITNQLDGLGLAITKLARGITSGSALEHANREMLADALAGRRPV